MNKTHEKFSTKLQEFSRILKGIYMFFQECLRALEGNFKVPEVVCTIFNPINIPGTKDFREKMN